MTAQKLQAIISYDPTATATEAKEMETETFYTVVETCGVGEWQHNTHLNREDAEDEIINRVSEDVANGYPEDISYSNYSIKEI